MLVSLSCLVFSPACPGSVGEPGPDMRSHAALTCHMQNAARDFNRFSKSRAYFAGLIPRNPTHSRVLPGNWGILRT
ncbi:protein of unknown function [Shinella sp. WSC3-e]|nr:hypothetical protein SHINE37_40257 [Rhizobiaceae bacterium]CAK7254941.1 protein of unknown function [Shinella sp. WSC3-e]